MTRLIIGAMVRTIGAHPSGWRYPGAHRDPRRDAAALRRTAQLAEAARLDYLFFGDRRAEMPGLGYLEPHLVARVDSLSAATYLAGATERIGLVSTANTDHADPYAIARHTAAADLLTDGRAGINLVVESEAHVDFRDHATDTAIAARYARADEFETVLRRLWDSFDDDAITADAATGEFVDPGKVHGPAFRGIHFTAARPLDVIRPVQGHLPVFHSGSSPRSRLFAALNADVALVAVRGRRQAAALREELRSLAFESGRDDRTLRVVTPVLPIVGETIEHAQQIADELSSLIRVAEDWPEGPPSGFPANRSLDALARLVGVALDRHAPDDSVTPQLASRFTTAGQELVELVAHRTGRVAGSEEPPTLRHLVAAASIDLLTFVGTGEQIASEFAEWADAGAVDGFNVLSATNPSQFEAFTRSVVPELQRLGVFPTTYEGETLRDHLGLARPDNVHRSVGDPRFPPVYGRGVPAASGR